ncbi:glycerol-3-phosphate acyltransferase ATS12, chloroplastic isoform X3 [Manihot esculenta]|uniref:glycerol-3-phosphate acyltransferase ATS12, chloroplastic isoform X3 n=1 Tax=Manihot esculenta TaxID=3983 RepID=UPI001CC59992|nr:glycerol-3-phosphate acyltransferase ATS12, chloroplastic isoform X3 [Manihot esculenta]
MIISALHPAFLCSIHSPRVSLSFPFLSSKLCLVPHSPSLALKSSARRSVCPCLISSLNANAMAQLVKEDKEAIASASGEKEEDKKEKSSHRRTFLDAKTEEDLLSGIRKQVEAGKLPLNVAAGMEEVYQNYRNAVLQSGIPNAKEIIVSNMAVAMDRMCLDVEDPFVFSPYHKALREPFDYYNFGQNYIRPLVDFSHAGCRDSYVGNISLFHEVEKQLQQGHNVVLISNHQTEADPAVIALLLEKTNPYIAENLIYVAGDRVITDPLCKPFSMGRNLICVYSKKHMGDDPELIEMKKRANIRSLKEMAGILSFKTLQHIPHVFYYLDKNFLTSWYICQMLLQANYSSSYFSTIKNTGHFSFFSCRSGKISSNILTWFLRFFSRHFQIIK